MNDLLETAIEARVVGTGPSTKPSTSRATPLLAEPLVVSIDVSDFALRSQAEAEPVGGRIE